MKSAPPCTVNPKKFDVQINALSKTLGGWDVFYQKYRGFYRDDSSLPVPANQPHPQRPDVVTEDLGINGVYFFNRHRAPTARRTTSPNGKSVV